MGVSAQHVSPLLLAIPAHPFKEPSTVAAHLGWEANHRPWKNLRLTQSEIWAILMAWKSLDSYLFFQMYELINLLLCLTATLSDVPLPQIKNPKTETNPFLPILQATGNNHLWLCLNFSPYSEKLMQQSHVVKSKLESKGRINDQHPVRKGHYEVTAQVLILCIAKV